MLQGYRVVEDSSTVLRGRLRETEQLRRHHGMPIRLEVRYDEFTTDIAENRILRAAVERMLRLPRVHDQAWRRLRRLRARLIDVSPVAPGQPLPGWQPTRLNARYHTALRLAELVWHNASVEHEHGPVAVNGFLVDMPRVFEDFVTVGLAEALVQHGGRACRQDSTWLAEGERGRVRIQPDLVW